jgi:LPXTG-site transpeptidase (sortase) family protein
LTEPEHDTASSKVLVRWLTVSGRIFVGVGLVVVLFVFHQLWFTSFQEQRSQDRLRRTFEQSIVTTTTTTTPASTPTSSPSLPTTTTTTPPVPAPARGEPIALLRIPRIGVDSVVVEGVGVEDLKKGPGHYPSTAFPGEVGNVGIAGHRTTYGRPFYDLDALSTGDVIELTTRQETFRYRVTRSIVVAPSAGEVLAQGLDRMLTLTTCTPRYSARQRLVVFASLEVNTTTTTTIPATTPTTVASGATTATTPPPAIDDMGLSGDRTATWPTVLWGLLTSLLAIVAWWVARRWHPIVVYLLSAAPILLSLHFVFESFARLFPSAI